MTQSRSGSEQRTRDEEWPVARSDDVLGAHRRELPGNAAGVADGLLEFIERSSAAIVIVDGDSMEIRYANPAFDRLSEPDDGSVQALMLTRALPHPAAEAISTLVHSLPRDDAARCDAEISSGRNGEDADWQVSVSRVPCHASRLCDLVLEIRDITREKRERRELADLLDQLREVNRRLLDSSFREADLATRAEAASEAKSTFLSTMSHELRTPLQAIIGYEELLADGLFGRVSALQRAQLARIKLSATHLLSLIEQVLTLARVEAGQETIRLSTVSVGELAEWTTAIVEPLARAKGLAFALSMADETVTLHTDPVKVRQILVNLLGNAVKFTDHGEVGLAVRGDGRTMTFVIHDTGIGILPDDLPRIFGEFWQVEQLSTRKVGGSGLGLSVSRRLARLLGGEVTAQSVVGAGSTFTFTLPLKDMPPA